MQRAKRFMKRGFTLVELMIVVVIVLILGTVAYVGWNKLTAAAKTTEAKTNVAGIADAAVAAYNRDTSKNELLDDKAQSTDQIHALCDDAANRVPDKPLGNKKYQPSTKDGEDFNTGDSATGWKCLRFSINNPILYSYGYVKGVGTGVGGAKASGFEVNALGDVDGNGKYSTFARGAEVRNGQIVLSTTVATLDETE